MLNIIRKNAQSIVVQSIVVIIAIVFIFWGVGTNLNDNPNAVAVVNGKEISYRDFQQNYERAIEGYKQQFGGQLPEKFVESLGVKDQVLNQLIQSELLRQGAEKMGMTISKEATQRKIQDLEVFRDENGRFDLDRYKTVLAQNRLSPTSFEAGIGNDLLMNRAVESLGAFATVSAAELDNWVEFLDQEVKLAYTTVRSSAYEPQVKVDDASLQSWYEQTKQQYKTPPQSKLAYLSFPFADDLKAVAVNDEAVQRYYQEHAELYATPEQRRARHILFKIADGDTAETKAAKKAAAEKVLAQIRGGGDFALLAKQFSEDTSKEKGGDLGFFSRGQMVEPFERSVFSLRTGEISGVVETPYGYHLVKLEEIKPATTRSLEEVRASIRAELERQGVKAITFKKASTAYEEIIRAGSLTKYSEKNAVAVHRTDFFQQDKPPKDTLISDPAFLQSAFALHKGELSSIVETATGYAIIFVEDARESVVPELAIVRERVAADFIKEKSVELARSAAEQMLKTAKEQQRFPSDVERKESAYLKRTGPANGVPEEIRRDAFARLGQGAFPDKVIVEGNTCYLYQILESRRGQGDTDAAKRQALEQQLLAAHKNTLMADWIDQLRKEAKIWTNTKMLQ
ncbi:PpiC-type peptidyl-prolyl cis-trans isomerase [Desulfobulbus propionicus DSM 2032]|jgi:peptidyl-prolyl cis-trans isomerase D|uniref:Periplasmic chaperone PpiD n=1 Tax=Desulfobulbus propionicus (strain ATCC 33891 / DSM 2032 / VKM B-1956 / 1pr3) TaxID=577650 RepID=A0A7U3YNQ4_DESPD|nr:SurA N-terminal domain-containing protein [Desulfobulbus propionicus]ADW18755.1 PpiC-type peptidyl-prolyl cis-trans isomerase [Desulfobulbus propionicus DSM 2032]